MITGGPATSDWYYSRTGADAGQQGGPLSWEQLATLAEVGVLKPADLVWNPSSPDWIDAAEVDGLFAATGPLSMPQIPAQRPGAAPAATRPPAYRPPGTVRPATTPPATTRPATTPPVSAPRPSTPLPRPSLRWLRLILPLVVVIVVAAGLVVGRMTAQDETGYDPHETGEVAGTAAPTTAPRPAVPVLQAEWTQVHPADGRPLARAAHTLVYDPVSDTLIMFGGIDSNTDFSDVWTCDPATGVWTLVEPAGVVPSARAGHATVYDSKTGKVILFGGWDGIFDSDETWAYDPATQTWTDLDPAGKTPTGRDGHAMAYDPVTGTVVLFGGWDGYEDLADTWVYDPAANTWTESGPGGYGPPARSCHTMACDPESGSVILFGGCDETQDFADTWAYDPAAGGWSELHPRGDSPPARDCHSMVFDTVAGRAVVFGGWDINDDFADTWAYDPAGNVWTELASAGASPAARGNSAMAYDSSRDAMFLFGGSASATMMNDTWAYDPAAGGWRELDPGSTLPTARDSHCVVCDPKSGQAILFGGRSGYGDTLGDTWSFDPAAGEWTELDPAGSLPAPRAGHRMVYEPDTGTIILFGGFSGDFDLDDTWAYDPATHTWTDLNPAGTLPPPRDSHSMVYDPVSQRVLLFGGRDDDDRPLGDLWAYDPAVNRWRELDPAGSTPAARAFHAMAFDPESATVVLFGGSSYDGSGTMSDGPVSAVPANTARRTEDRFGDTWTYDPAAGRWTEVEPLGEQPYPRDDHAMVYDPASQSVLLFGGWDGYAALDDAWALDVPTSTWRKVYTATAEPSARLSTAVAWDETSGRVVLFGGWDGYSALNDTWLFWD